MAEQIFVKMVEAYSMGDQHAPASSRHTKSSKDPFDEDEEDEEEEKEVEEEDEFPSPFDGMDSLSSNNIRIYVSNNISGAEIFFLYLVSNCRHGKKDCRTKPKSQ